MESAVLKKHSHFDNSNTAMKLLFWFALLFLSFSIKAIPSRKAAKSSKSKTPSNEELETQILSDIASVQDLPLYKDFQGSLEKVTTLSKLLDAQTKNLDDCGEVLKRLVITMRSLFDSVDHLDAMKVVSEGLVEEIPSLSDLKIRNLPAEHKVKLKPLFEELHRLNRDVIEENILMFFDAVRNVGSYEGLHAKLIATASEISNKLPNFIKHERADPHPIIISIFEWKAAIGQQNTKYLKELELIQEHLSDLLTLSSNNDSVMEQNDTTDLEHYISFFIKLLRVVLDYSYNHLRGKSAGLNETDKPFPQFLKDQMRVNANSKELEGTTAII